MLTQEELKKLLHYDPDTGIFTWLPRPYDKRWTKRYAGKPAGTLHHRGYITIIIKAKYNAAHRLAYLYMTGQQPKGDIDHINGVKKDNRWLNLRDVPHSVNSKNRALNKNNSSGIAGVSWRKTKNYWFVTLAGQYLGTHEDFFEACCMRLSAQHKEGYIRR